MIRIFAGIHIFVLLLSIMGCVSAGGDKPLQPEVKAPPIFPAQSTLQSGNYEAFRKENEENLKACQDPEQCSIALFNLSFLYCYSKSPYYNPVRGTLYLEDLIKGAPESPWAYHARVWIDLMKRPVKVEARKRPAREEAKPREVASQEVAKMPEPAQDSASEAGTGDEERQRLEAEIQYKNELIKELNSQIQRARQIDIEIEKKERGLLY